MTDDHELIPFEVIKREFDYSRLVLHSPVPCQRDFRSLWGFDYLQPRLVGYGKLYIQRQRVALSRVSSV